MHLTNDSLCALATLVAEDLPFTEQDAAAMQHVGACEACYAQLQRYIAVLTAIDSEQILAAARAEKPETQQAVIRIMFVDAGAILRQCGAENAGWIFDTAFTGAYSRAPGGQKRADMRVEDIQNAETFVSFDAERRELTVQLDSRRLSAVPRVYLRFASGQTRELRLSQKAYLMVAKVEDLPEEDFDVVMEKAE